MNFCNKYAQTNVQLFAQMQSEGYSRDERQLVFESYEFGMQLFCGLFLPSGKPFIDHLVGTASILVSLRTPAHIVAAGLLHAVYVHGNFGSARKGITKRKQRTVRNAVGNTIEEYVARYERLLWNKKNIPVLRASLHDLNQKDREVLLIRLANELEHKLDLAGLYYARSEEAQARHKRKLENYGPMMAEMARTLGYSALATEMDVIFNESLSAPVPIAPCIRTSSGEAYLVTSGSYGERLWVRVYRKLRGVSRTASYILQQAKVKYRKYLTLSSDSPA